MNRQQRQSLAEHTIRILEEDGYELSGAGRVDFNQLTPPGQGESRLWRPDELAELAERHTPSVLDRECEITLENTTTLAAARRLASHKDKPPLCLNFASAKNPGGGFLGGSQAQEESLARSSCLYTTLLRHEDYYRINRACRSALYTDHMIVSERVPVFRDDEGALLPRPYHAGFITAPAPNAGAASERDAPDLIPTLRRRARMVLCLADHIGARDLVLGAWGCGVFRNEPALVAQIFAQHLLPGGDFARSFERVNFAVLDATPQRSIITPFSAAFAEVLA